MIEEYSVGMKLTADDFVNPIYFPKMKWEYAQIDEITDDTVTVHYYDFNDPQGELVKTYTRDDMNEMLGWNLTSDDSTIEIVDGTKGASNNEIACIMSSSTLEKNGSYELLDSNPCAYVKVDSCGKVKQMFIFASREQCEREFRRANAR